MSHQHDGIRFLKARKCGVLLHDRGLGKTAQALVALESVVMEYGPALYVAPLSTVKNIEREASVFAPSLRCELLIGSVKSRMKSLANKSASLFIINYEGLRVIAGPLLERRFQIIVSDELTRIKGRDTVVSKMMSELGRHAKVRWGLGSMPFSEGIEEAWGQFNFVQPGLLGKSFYEFRNRYCVLKEMHFGGRRFKKIVGYKNVPEFEGRISSMVHRRSKEDCLDLPPKTHQKIYVPLEKTQREIYRSVEKQAFTELGDRTVTHSMAVTKLGKCRQVAAGFLYDDDRKWDVIPSGKLGELEAIVSEMSGRQKMVIFTAFRAEPVMISAHLAKTCPKVGVYELADNPLHRQEVIDDWSAFNEPAVLIANVRSGGTGLNLQAADTAVFFTNDWSYECRAQAEDRIHRIGQTSKNILIIDILTEETIEEDVHLSLLKKQDLVETFLARLERRKEDHHVA
jgi:SNF2 family DNA or RNA helicase